MPILNGPITRRTGGPAPVSTGRGPQKLTSGSTRPNEVTVTSLTMVAGPLQEGAKVALQLAPDDKRLAYVVSCQQRALVLDVPEGLPDGTVEDGSIVDLLMPRSVGMYKWLCMVSPAPRGNEVSVQILDGPMFVQRRLGPRVDANLPAEVRHVRASHRGVPYRALVADLSHGGLKLLGPKPLRTGDTIEVTMDLRGSVVSLMGRVVMAYPSPGLAEPGSTDAHVAFHEGQRRGIESVDRFVAEQLACQWKG